MTTAIETIMNELNKIFVDMDAKVLEETKIWAVGRAAAIKEFKSSQEAKEIVKDQWRYYAKLYDIAGGKTWYGILNNNTPDRINAFVEKNCAAIAEKRNASISKKLIKAEVTDVVDTTFTRTHDGFNGVFVVNTNKGKKVVTIDTIYAGGYNVQCLHLRVLVKVK